jgi:hypothetical protein
MTIVTVNGVDCESGCWVEGHWGQYGGDHLADKLDGILDLEPDDDPRELRKRAEALEEQLGYKREPICDACHQPLDYRRDRERWVHVLWFRTIGVRLELDHALWCGMSHDPKPTWPVASIWEARTEAIDRITDRLNELTPDGWTWDWVDGEFYLMPICDDEENCTDETCAHWSYA